MSELDLSCIEAFEKTQCRALCYAEQRVKNTFRELRALILGYWDRKKVESILDLIGYERGLEFFQHNAGLLKANGVYGRGAAHLKRLSKRDIAPATACSGVVVGIGKPLK